MIEENEGVPDQVLADLFEDGDGAGLHDVIVDLYDYLPSVQELKALLYKLPDHIVLMAYEYGLDDTVFLESAYVTLEANNFDHWFGEC